MGRAVRRLPGGLAVSAPVAGGATVGAAAARRAGYGARGVQKAGCGRVRCGRLAVGAWGAAVARCAGCGGAVVRRRCGGPAVGARGGGCAAVLGERARVGT
ncbi:hypothetical protein Aab01nite_16530 [Paractinoplanes abujensis]|nr:hypothetical protein Aab01nite_16530 [Actinoplanes abujensis]